MEIQLNRVYRKSDKGIAELRSRAGGLTIRARTTLILVNGQDSAAQLQAKVGADTVAQLQALAQQGYIEWADVDIPLPIPAPTATPLAAPQDAEWAARLSQLRRAALASLTPLFGPDVVIVAEPLLKARTAKAFNAALQDMESKLNIYLGRKRAAALVDSLRP